mmetsp:Transcript_26994/g.64819  ORF Transcript_26994/g.64819 Transcript_26994/m.64819 type:complete len:277 (-) Transcript_26994:111-941(-)
MQHVSLLPNSFSCCCCRGPKILLSASSTLVHRSLSSSKYHLRSSHVVGRGVGRRVGRGVVIREGTSQMVGEDDQYEEVPEPLDLEPLPPLEPPLLPLAVEPLEDLESLPDLPDLPLPQEPDEPPEERGLDDSHPDPSHPSLESSVGEEAHASSFAVVVDDPHPVKGQKSLRPPPSPRRSLSSMSAIASLRLPGVQPPPPPDQSGADHPSDDGSVDADCQPAPVDHPWTGWSPERSCFVELEELLDPDLPDLPYLPPLLDPLELLGLLELLEPFPEE